MKRVKCFFLYIFCLIFFFKCSYEKKDFINKSENEANNNSKKALSEETIDSSMKSCRCSKDSLEVSEDEPFVDPSYKGGKEKWMQM